MNWRLLAFILPLLSVDVLAVSCPAWRKFGPGPPSEALCTKPSDPNKLPASPLEQWFTKANFTDLFPKANIGWGPTQCWPYSYEAFVIAARYFPKFGADSPNSVYTAAQNYRRDVAAFFSHAIQETGENDLSLYSSLPAAQAADCFYRGGFFNWFEGGPISSFLPPATPGYSPADGVKCNAAGKYCASDVTNKYFYPCRADDQGCYFGRGAVQISYNFNYGQFQLFLKSKNINVDLLNNPNLVVTKMDPPLTIMASLWFYMTPQPPNPSMHSIVLGEWQSGDSNKAAGFSGPIFGPTSLIINNECGGEDPNEPGGGGESRRIKAFKYFTKLFGVPAGADKSLSCKGMPQIFGQIGSYPKSFSLDWSGTWKDQPCNCVGIPYSGAIPYFDPAYYPAEFVAQNEANRKRCVASVYGNPGLYNAAAENCLKFPPPA